MAIRNRLCPAADQAAVLECHCDHARFVWNLAVEQQAWWRPGRKAAPSSAARFRQLAEVRAAEPWLAAGSSDVQQQALRDFDRALAAYFNKANPAGEPTYRSKRGVQGFVIRDTKVRRLNRRWGAVFVPKCGYVRFRWTRQLPARLAMSRVTLDRTGRWHVSFWAPQPSVQREGTGTAVGIDRGVRTALVDSNGQHYRAPRLSDRQAARYLVLQRRMSRQRRGSQGRERTRGAIALIDGHAKWRRKDWAEKISAQFVRENDLIVLEKLNVRSLTRRPAPKPDPDQDRHFLPNRASSKAALSRGILASCWGTLALRLEQKGTAAGVTVVQIDPRFTSQQCHVCGHTAAGNRESQAVFRCESCGHEDHADRNAARNILARGLLLATGELVPAHAPGHGASRPQKPPALAGAAGTTRSAA